MESPLPIAAVALAMLAVSAFAQPTSVAGVASVIDGDTIEIHGDRIRLSGFDAPERGRRCAGGVNAHQRASLALSDVIARRTVQCSVSDVDRYGRYVAQCSVGGADLGSRMVEQGWARDWRRYSGGRYADAERRARAARLGLWGMECPGLWGDRNYD